MIRGVRLSGEGFLDSRRKCFVNFCKNSKFLFSNRDCGEIDRKKLFSLCANGAPIYHCHKSGRVFSELPSLLISSISKTAHKSFVSTYKNTKFVKTKDNEHLASCKSLWLLLLTLQTIYIYPTCTKPEFSCEYGIFVKFCNFCSPNSSLDPTYGYVC